MKQAAAGARISPNAPPTPTTPFSSFGRRRPALVSPKSTAASGARFSGRPCSTPSTTPRTNAGASGRQEWHEFHEEWGLKSAPLPDPGPGTAKPRVIRFIDDKLVRTENELRHGDARAGQSPLPVVEWLSELRPDLAAELEPEPAEDEEPELEEPVAVH